MNKVKQQAGVCTECQHKVKEEPNFCIYKQEASFLGIKN